MFFPDGQVALRTYDQDQEDEATWLAGCSYPATVSYTSSVPALPKQQPLSVIRLVRGFWRIGSIRQVLTRSRSRQRYQRS